jgi:large subunit ribosomal protein L25
MKQAIITSIPLNFNGSDDNEAIRLGAILNQFINAVEVSCLPADMPNGIDVDITNLAIGDHISLTGLTMPEGVTLTALTHGDIEAHDQSVVAVQEPKLMAEEVEEEIVETEGAEGENAEGGDNDAESGDSDSDS